VLAHCQARMEVEGQGYPQLQRPPQSGFPKGPLEVEVEMELAHLEVVVAPNLEVMVTHLVAVVVALLEDTSL
jgi:hypothetical protein